MSLSLVLYFSLLKGRLSAKYLLWTLGVPQIDVVGPTGQSGASSTRVRSSFFLSLFYFSNGGPSFVPVQPFFSDISVEPLQGDTTSLFVS